MTFVEQHAGITRNPNADEVRRKGQALILKTFLELATPIERAVVERWIERVGDERAQPRLAKVGT